MKTVAEVIEMLKQFPQDLPVMFANTGRIYDEYSSVKKIRLDHLKNQNTDGDPEYYWCDPEDLEDGQVNQVNEIVLIRN